MITAKINVSKIDKSKLYKGKNGTYLDIVLIESQNDQYGNDFMVVQGVSKEDRAAGKRGAILGNAKVFQKQQQQQRPAAPAALQNSGAPESADDDVPF